MIDLSPTQIEGVPDRWGQLPGARHLQGEVLALLTSADEQWDAIYSSWGALWFTGRQVWIYRWAYEPSTWADLLHDHGFVDIHARIEPAPQPDNLGTLLVEARREH